MNDKKIELTLGLVNAVMQYLGTRPYAEVAEIEASLQAQIALQKTPVTATGVPWSS